MLKMAFGIFFTITYSKLKGEVFPVVGKEIIQNNCPSKIKTFQVKPYCIKFLHTMNILYLSKVIT